MDGKIGRGDKVIWLADGVVKGGFVVDTYLQSGGNASINSTVHNPASKNALLIEMEDGSKVLKLENEVKPA